MKYLLPVGVVIFLTLALAATLRLTGQKQDIRQKAAPATTLTLLRPDGNSPVAPGNTFTANVEINTGTNIVAAADIKIVFNPIQLELLSIVPGTLLPTELLTTTIDNTAGNGRIVVGLPAPTAGVFNPGVTGTGTVVTLTFRADATGMTQIGFDPTTGVVGLGQDKGQNVLSATVPLTITISSPSPTPTPRPTPTASPTPRPTPSATPSATPSPSPRVSPSPTPRATPLSTPRATPSPTPRSTPSATPRATPSATPRATPRATPSATPQPSASPTPSPTVIPSAAPVILNVRLEGVTTMRPDDRFISVVIRQGTIVIETQTIRVRSDAQGVYSNQFSDPTKLVNIPVGTYDFLINGPVHLTRIFLDVNLTAGTNMVDLTTPLLTGDIQDNNSIDLGDYNRLIENFGCVVGGPIPPGKNCSPLDADLDYDHDVDIFDYAFLVGNYGVNGDQ